APPPLSSFPTRRSSDLAAAALSPRRVARAAHAGDDRARPSRGLSADERRVTAGARGRARRARANRANPGSPPPAREGREPGLPRSEEHTSELQSRFDLV